MRAVTLISGAFGIFRRDAAIQVNGYRHDRVGEDFELIVKLHRAMIKARRPYAIRFVPEPVCWRRAFTKRQNPPHSGAAFAHHASKISALWVAFAGYASPD